MDESNPQTPEHRRLDEDNRRARNWKRWGPYLAERQWATVREDYSPDGESWHYFPHDHARSRAYRWGEDGLLGFTDRECRLCFGLALWNGKDSILKERLFGLTGPEGNHGEDVKEEYFYLDSTPTHSWAKALYKYPQAAFPYERIVSGNQARSKEEPEFELADAGVFDEDRYFDVQVEYAKQSPDDILIRVTAWNRGPDPAVLHVLPTVWFRNTWSWGQVHEESAIRPSISQAAADRLVLEHETLGRFILAVGPGDHGRLPPLLFTDNHTNHARFPEVSLAARFSKDAFHERVIKGRRAVVNPKLTGTKAAAHYQYEVVPGERVEIRLRLFAEAEAPEGDWRAGFDELMETRRREADEYYATVVDPRLDEDERRIARQAYAGLLWSKQFYYYAVEDWLSGDPELPFEAWASRREGRNREWTHLFTRNLLSMPDKWEYPWFAAWDLAFHMIPFAKIDPEFAKYQLTLLLREWYMHPNGQLPAYEFNFSDVNPPVHAWAAWRVYKISAPPGRRDREFLESVFQKLLLNFTWWVNRKDVLGKNLFAGGFLGLDNIGVFDRSKPLPTGGTLRQADATAWMAFYCSTMLAMALELAREGDRVRVPYEDMASKFFEHFIQITDSMNTHGGTGLWDEEDGFYYDQIQSDHEVIPLKTRSLVGLLPLIAVEVIEEDVIRSLPGFNRRFQWFVKHRQDLAQYITYCELEHHHRHRLLAIPSRDRLERVLRYLLDESEFLSPHGIRSLSRFHEREPYVFRAQDMEHRVEYLPGESNSGMFGGNSNWRGPVWFPVNYLLKEALERYHYFYGDSFQVECPTGSGNRMNLLEVARELDRRLVSLFRRDESGSRPCFGGDTRFREHPHWRDLLWFHEYFHAETGRGLGASHQTGWTALVIRHLEDIARLRA